MKAYSLALFRFKMAEIIRKVEIPFDYVHDSSEVDFRNYESLRLVRRQLPILGLDISLYFDSKLCLSPIDYCNLQEHEREVCRALRPEQVRPIFARTIDRVLDGFSDAERVYQIREAQVGIQGFDYGSCPHVLLRRHLRKDFEDYKELFVHDREDRLRLEILKRFWCREHPGNIDVNGYRGNDMSVYIVGKNFDVFWQIIENTNLDLLEKADDDRLKETCSVKISNMSHGYRMRIECSDRDSLDKVITSI